MEKFLRPWHAGYKYPLEYFVKPWNGGYKYAKNWPEHYKCFLQELMKPSTPVHYKYDPRKWYKDPETGEIKRVQNEPIPVIYPKDADNGIWGGEGIIKGYKKKHRYHTRIAHWWIPQLIRTIVYSEILDKYMRVTVTPRTLKLIDDHYGFDNYILKTPVQDLKSQLALDLRRLMLLTLVRREMYPDDPEKQEKIYKKYEAFIIPEEEAEWFGLSLRDAFEKQISIEKSVKPVPLKQIYRKELFEKLKEMKIEEEASKESSSGSWLSNIKLFGRQ
ncbi:39S ribosomal protein L28, mitochondrial-like isoform X2 [Centruroides sculpturatus]|uniref:39S ribosomal protein L28, mitochondrial-like isoform X1 n=1 Tax=Centruroides sculpturatus TaxID=218467 RepID=UPI000C6CB14A|nr:39S ribosomal protein L28, mitochondrial-like isoform X1 [Centruroides sculpturatus]XP_023243241.1 39S ribosomal protein L28, mitochondrial-like isoform X2 [Centruroides sculpturatus]